MNTTAPDAVPTAAQPSTRRWLRRLAVALPLVVLAILLTAWLALPGLLKTRAETWVADHSGHALTLGAVRINPLQLRLDLDAVTLDTPSGERLLQFDALVIDLAASSLVQRAPVFDALRLSGVQLRFVQGKQGSNWSPLIEALSGPPTQADPASTPEPLPALTIAALDLEGAALDYIDQRQTPALGTRLAPLDVALRDVSTRADGQGQLQLDAATSNGLHLSWQGSVDLNPLQADGALRLAADDLARLAPWMPAPAPLRIDGGQAQISGHTALHFAQGTPQITLGEVQIELSKLALAPPASKSRARANVERIALSGGQVLWPQATVELPQARIEGVRLGHADSPNAPALALEAVAAEHLKLDLTQRAAQLGSLTLNAPALQLLTSAQGRLNLAELINEFTPPPSPDTAPPWRYRIDALNLNRGQVALRDANRSPPLALDVDAINISLRDIDERLDQPLPFSFAARLRSGGNLLANGRLTPITQGAPAVDATLHLDALALKPAQPWLTDFAALEIRDGTLSAKGKLRHDARSSRYNGSLRIDALNLTQEGLDQTFLGWQSLNAPRIDAGTAGIEIPELRSEGLRAAFIIYSDKSINLKRIQRAPAAPTESAPTTAPTTAQTTAPTTAQTTTATTASAPTFPIRIDRLRVRDGRLDFGDYSLVLPFAARIHELSGSVANLSNSGASASRLELDGTVDDYGMARARGELDLFDPTARTRLDVSFRNVEMTRLTPYLATFAGRSIRGGSMSLDLGYTVRERQLDGSNALSIQSLQLGDRVNSPSAMDLPLDLAIALLEDSDGRINLQIPVSGNLDAPGFSYGHVVWQAVRNILTKIATAPFRALGALFGGSGEAEPVIAFEPGAARLTPPEREKLVKLTAGLQQRAQLHLTARGQWHAADRVALQETALRRALLAQSGQPVAADEDPGVIVPSAPAMRQAIDALALQRWGQSELATLRAAHTQANPDAPPPAAPVMQRLMAQVTKLLDAPRAPSAEEIADARGQDMHTWLYARLRRGERVSDTALNALAAARAAYVATALSGAQLPAARWRTEVGAGETALAEGAALGLRLELAPLPK